MTHTDGYPQRAIYLTADEVRRLLGVRPATLRQWVTRGHVAKRGRDQYDMGSVMTYLDQRGELRGNLHLTRSAL